MIVVTGGAGFIGSCILARLNKKGRKDIIVVDHLNHPGKKENLKDKKFTQYFEKKDFLDLVVKDKLVKDLDLVIHMGACSSTVLQDKEYFEENNFQYSCKLAEWCLKHGVRFIYASSAATYGDGSGGYSDLDSVTRRCRPLNFYGESKQKFDLWVLEKKAAEKFVGLKFFNVFGPNEYHKGEMQSVIAKAFDRVVREGTIGLFKSYQNDYKDGEQKRDFIYVKDAVDIVMYFIESHKLSGIYNVGTGKARSWNDVACSLFAAVGKKSCIEYIDMPEIMRSRYQYFTEADMSKLRKAGYEKPFTELEKAVLDYSQYLKSHARI